jgi:hypothetical protein
MPITFVSAFIDLKEERDPRHTPVSRFHFFEELASTGIHIHLYLSSCYKELYDKIVGPRSNVFVELIELSDLLTYRELAGLSYGIPATDNPTKDTAHYHILNNAKIEFVTRAIGQEIFRSDTYAWIDFSVGHVFRNSKETLKYLQDVAGQSVKGLHFPGCWPSNYGVGVLFSRISLRFCGGFFVGDSESLLDFSGLYRAKFRSIVKKGGVLPWEVNVWHYMEVHEEFSPTWYAADHNDSIVRFREWQATR